jgi:hypothetical protein
MKIKNYRYLILIVVFLLTTHLHAQVTIGSSIEPAEGALLDIKSYTPDGTNATTDKGGLLYPRVLLTAKNILDPIIENPTEAQKKALVGLTVYNVSPSSNFTPGIYYWDGEKWEKSGAPEYIWMPSFTLPWGPTNTPISVDLYAVYIDNLESVSGSDHTTVPSEGVNPTGDGHHKYLASDGSSPVQPFGTTLPASGDFIYIITDYDDTVIDDVAISPTGILTYTPAVATLPSGTYVNIILKKK